MNLFVILKNNQKYFVKNLTFHTRLAQNAFENSFYSFFFKIFFQIFICALIIASVTIDVFRVVNDILKDTFN